MGNDDSGFFDTRRAAAYLGLSRRTLDGYRVPARKIKEIITLSGTPDQHP